MAIVRSNRPRFMPRALRVNETKVPRNKCIASESSERSFSVYLRGTGMFDDGTYDYRFDGVDGDASALRKELLSQG